MKIGRINPLTEQHWTHLLMLFITLLTGVLTDEHVIQAPLAGTATLSFNVTGGMKITQIELNRWTDGKVFVFSPAYGLSILNNSYNGRLSAISNHSLILEKLQESDFGTYCYKLTVFPNGSLEGKIKLVKQTTKHVPSGPSNIMVISLTCGISLAVLCGIITGVVCHKKELQRPSSTPTQREQEEEHNDGNYLKVV